MIAEYMRNEQDDFEAVVISDDGSDSSLAIMISLSEPTAQDIDAGVGGYCVVVDGGPTYYGGVDDVSSMEGGLRIDFSHDASTALGVNRRVEIPLSPNNSSYIVEKANAIIDKRPV